MFTTRINSEGKRELASTSHTQGYDFHPCQVEVEQSYTIREIYDRWKRGKPTSVHPFNCEFDDDADDIDHDLENPIDICQVENNVSNLRDHVEFEKQEAKVKRKKKEDFRREREEFVESLVQKLPKKD